MKMNRIKGVLVAALAVSGILLTTGCIIPDGPGGRRGEEHHREGERHEEHHDDRHDDHRDERH